MWTAIALVCCLVADGDRARLVVPPDPAFQPEPEGEWEVVALGAYKTYTRWPESELGVAPTFRRGADGSAEVDLGPADLFEPVSAVGVAFRPAAGWTQTAVRSGHTNAIRQADGTFGFRHVSFFRPRQVPTGRVRVLALGADLGEAPLTVGGPGFRPAECGRSGDILEVPLAGLPEWVGVNEKPPTSDIVLITAATRPPQFSGPVLVRKDQPPPDEPVFLQEGFDQPGRLGAECPRPVRGGVVEASIVFGGPGPTTPVARRRVPVDADGRFVVPDIPYECHAFFAASAEGWSSGPCGQEAGRAAVAALRHPGVRFRTPDAFDERAAAYPVLAGRFPDELVLPMQSNGSLEIVVTWPDGRPASGVRVSPALGLRTAINIPDAVPVPRVGRPPHDRDSERFPPQTTDAEGRVRFESLPAGPLNLFDTAFVPTFADVLPLRREVLGDRQPVPLVAGKTMRLAVTIRQDNPYREKQRRQSGR